MFHRFRKIFWLCSRSGRLQDERISSFTREIPEKARIEKEEFVKINTRTTHPIEIISQEGIDILCSKLWWKPFWPQGVEVPRCNAWHHHSFIAQIISDDIPNFPKSKIIYFHYCEACSRNGNMSWWQIDEIKDRYAITIVNKYDKFSCQKSERMEGAEVMKEWKIIFSSRVETVSLEEAEVISKSPNIPDITRLMLDDLDEEDKIYNYWESKLWGYPSWLQGYENPWNNFRFAFQLSGEICPDTSWCNGNVYIFVDFNKNVWELVLQTT